jgi:hypothetical protein
VSQDTNGTQDVYEWEEDGVGTCDTGPGCVSLISSGASPEASSFLDASADGDDVFFLTRAQLVAGDTDNLLDAYDARAPHVAGEAVGFPAPPSPQPPCRSGEACKEGTQPTPSLSSPGSTSFSGPENPEPKKCAKGKIAKHGRCVKKKHSRKNSGKHKKSGKKQDRKHHRKKAGHDRGGSK